MLMLHHAEMCWLQHILLQGTHAQQISKQAAKHSEELQHARREQAGRKQAHLAAGDGRRQRRLPAVERGEIRRGWGESGRGSAYDSRRPWRLRARSCTRRHRRLTEIFEGGRPEMCRWPHRPRCVIRVLCAKWTVAESLGRASQAHLPEFRSPPLRTDSSSSGHPDLAEHPSRIRTSRWFLSLCPVPPITPLCSPPPDAPPPLIGFGCAGERERAAEPDQSTKTLNRVPNSQLVSLIFTTR
jgi:hypothetical protein